MPQTVGQFAQKMSRMGPTLSYAQDRAVGAAALVITTEIRRTTAAATGGDMRLSNWRGAGTASVGYSPVSGGKTTIKPRNMGLSIAIESGTRPHTIRPKKSTRGRGRNKRRRALAVNGGFYASVRHPGTSGKQPFMRGYRSSRDNAVRKFREVVSREIERALS